MRVLIAPDSFGGTLSASEAAEAIAAGWRRVAPGDEVVLLPMSDGGPGFVETVAAAVGGHRIPVTVPDPLGRPVAATVLVTPEGTAYVETAQAAGLHLLAPEERDPRVTSSYGVGVLLLAAVETGARTVVLGLGGSATNDGGAGLLAAVGVVARAANGAPLPSGGAALLALDRLDGVPLLRGVELVLASDVDNPLTGPYGASAVFGPQKGADPETVAVLDAALATFGAVAERDLPTAPLGLASCPGSGAAGGIGAAGLALGARRESGVGLVRRVTGLDRLVAGVDLVLTGEGSFDAQSLHGKVAVGVAAAAREYGVGCLVLAGQVRLAPAGSDVDDDARDPVAAAGVTGTYSVADELGSVDAALRRPAAGLADLAARVAREHHPKE